MLLLILEKEEIWISEYLYSNTSYVAINRVVNANSLAYGGDSNTSYVAINRKLPKLKDVITKFKYIVCCY